MYVSLVPFHRFYPSKNEFWVNSLPQILYINTSTDMITYTGFVWNDHSLVYDDGLPSLVQLVAGVTFTNITPLCVDTMVITRVWSLTLINI